MQLRNLNLNHIYAVRVRAENDFGVSDPSQPVTSRLLTRSKNRRGNEGLDQMIWCFLADERRPEDQVEPTSRPKRAPTSAFEDYGGKSSS